MADSYKVGEAPWEKQNAAPADSFPAGQAPWEQGSIAPPVEEDNKGDVIVNDTHPELDSIQGVKTRFVYKNFGADPVASFNYLQKQYPDMEWKLDPQGEPIMRKRGENVFHRLDPKGFDVQDIPDIAYDVGSGVVQGAATALGGIGGGIAGAPTVVGAPVGALAGASAASAATGAGAEALRQKLGNLSGIDQSVSGGDVTLAGGIGAVSPLLFGTGAGLAQAEKSLVKYGLGSGAKQAAADLANAQRGLVGLGYDKAAGVVGPKIAEFTSGIPAEITKTAAKILPALKAADKSSEVMATPLREASTSVPKILKEQTRTLGGRLDELRGMIDNQPGLVVAGEPGVMQAAQGSIPTESIKKPFQDLAEKLVSTATGTEAQKRDLEKLASVMKSELNGLPDNMTAAQADALEKRFKALAEQHGMNYGKSGATVSALEGANAYDAQIAQAFEQSRRNIRQGIIDRLEQVNRSAAEEYGQIVDQYSNMKKMAELHKNDFKTSKSVKNFLNRAINDPNELQNLTDLQNATGYDLVGLAKENKAIQTFSKPSGDIQSLRGSTSTTRTVPLALAGGALGYYAGQQSGGEYSPYLMSATGALLGGKLASPLAIRKYMEMNAAARAIPQSSLYKFAPYTLMNMSSDKGRK